MYLNNYKLHNDSPHSRTGKTPLNYYLTAFYLYGNLTYFHQFYITHATFYTYYITILENKYDWSDTMDFEKLFEYFKSMSTKSFVLYIIIFSALITNGILVIYLSENDLFMNLDTVKLILLSVSITLPQVIIYSLTVFFIWVLSHKIKISEIDENSLKLIIVTGCIITTVLQAGSLLFSLTFSLELEHHLLILTIPVLCILFIIYLINIFKTHKKKK